MSERGPTPEASGPAVRPPAISLVVSTIGRPDHLARLVRSLVVESASIDLELIVADQSRDATAAAVVGEHAGDAFAWQVVRSGGGVSRGRNDGLARATAPIVTFPDDDCWFPGTSLAQAVAHLTGDPSLVAVTGILHDATGRPHMLRWQQTSGPVTKANYYRTSIGATLFARTAHVRAIAGYDVRVGPGAGTPLGSCEDADVVLRLVALGPVTYLPQVRVHHDAMTATLESSVAAKLYGYGVGQAWFWKRHDYPRAHVAWLLGRKAVKVGLGTARGRGAEVAPDRAFLRGALDGLRGRVDLDR